MPTNQITMFSKYLNSTLWLICIAVILSSCGLNSTSTKHKNIEQWNLIPLKYATGFTIEKYQNKTRVTIKNPSDTSKIIKQVILVSTSDKSTLRDDEIAIPSQKIICSSSTQLAYFLELKAYQNIVGINSSRYLHNEEMNKLVTDKKIARIGKEGLFNKELIVGLEPDVIMVSPFKTGGYNAMKNLEINLVPMAAHKEMTPLAKAEWIKMVGLFVGKEKRANEIFNEIDKKYNELKKMASGTSEKPTIFSGKLIGDKWYVPGGNSFYAHYFKDAGASYIFKNNKTGAEPMDFEAVFETAQNADYWRVLTSSVVGFNKKMFLSEDRRYDDFKAFKENHILVCNIREIPFYEQNPVKPHVILADYIFHFHRELLPKDYQPTFWNVLE